MTLFDKRYIHVLVLLVLVLCTPFIVQSQEHSSFIGYRMGPSIPLGRYYMNDPEVGSYANPGMSFSLEGAWFFKPYLGVGAEISENLHPLDSYNLAYGKVIADPSLESLSLQSEPYEVRTYMAGLYFRWPIYKEKLFVQVKGLGGMIWMRAPDQLYAGTFFMGLKHSWCITSARDKKFGFLAGTGIEYYLFDRVGLILNAEYTKANMQFTYFTADDSYVKTHYVSYLNVVLGININL